MQHDCYIGFCDQQINAEVYNADRRREICDKGRRRLHLSLVWSAWFYSYTLDFDRGVRVPEDEWRRCKRFIFGDRLLYNLLGRRSPLLHNFVIDICCDVYPRGDVHAPAVSRAVVRAECARRPILHYMQSCSPGCPCFSSKCNEYHQLVHACRILRQYSISDVGFLLQVRTLQLQPLQPLVEVPSDLQPLVHDNFNRRKIC